MDGKTEDKADTRPEAEGDTHEPSKRSETACQIFLKYQLLCHTSMSGPA